MASGLHGPASPQGDLLFSQNGIQPYPPQVERIRPMSLFPYLPNAKSLVRHRSKGRVLHSLDQERT